MRLALLTLTSFPFVLVPAFAIAEEFAEAEPPCLALDATSLSQLAGTWSVEWHYRIAPGEFAVSTAHAEILEDLLGCSITERFLGSLRGAKYSAVTMISRPSQDVYDRVRIDSEHGTFSQSSGSKAGNSLVFEWSRELTTRVVRTRHYYKDIEPSSFTVEFFMSPREEASWELVHRAHYRRAVEVSTDQSVVVE